ncbi:hypothetical protein VXT29_10715 [Escherichia coli]|uniref:hypothetical protein n=1 Tax=Escherichia coli TaxID=562 RepID=UPI002E1945F6|nr:hypothetical protein [Escherichia coli]
MKPAYKPVLCVVSSHPIKGASGVPTGFFLAELTHPLKVLEDAGIKTTIASIRGGQPPVDGFNLSDPVNAWYWNETEAPNWSENVVTDDRLITGQNPASAHGVGVALLNALRRTA